ncbi:MAG: TetR/AcrR family transcriptional regulator [Pseudomonadota bacterium]
MDKKTEIIRSALGAFATHGYSGASLSLIASQAGTNKQLITHHFGSKEKLWRAVIDYELEDGVELMRRVGTTETREGPGAALRQFVQEYVAWVATKTSFQAMLMFESRLESPRLDWLAKAHILPSAKVVMSLISACQKTGEVRAGDVGRMYFTLLHLANSPFVSARQFRLIVGREPSAEAELDGHRQTILSYLGMAEAEQSS